MKSGIYGELGQDICRNCGSRHFANSRQNRICGGMVGTQDWQRSAAGITELASVAREDAISHWNAAQLATPGGSRQLRHLREAAEAFTRVYELEN